VALVEPRAAPGRRLLRRRRGGSRSRLRHLEVDGGAGRHGFTGVRRTARGRGIAGAVKRAQIAWAKQHGLRTLRTANELRLPQMLALNERHGYRPLYTELVLRGPAV
jgi:GNAT superfamily N-acetyltransferase